MLPSICNMLIFINKHIGHQETQSFSLTKTLLCLRERTEIRERNETINSGQLDACRALCWANCNEREQNPFPPPMGFLWVESWQCGEAWLAGKARPTAVEEQLAMWSHRDDNADVTSDPDHFVTPWTLQEGLFGSTSVWAKHCILTQQPQSKGLQDDVDTTASAVIDSTGVDFEKENQLFL